MSLKKKALSGSAWAAASQFSQLFLQFGVGIILARLLDPAEYGLVALGTVFLVILQTFAEGGFGLAVIQRKDLTDEDCSTAFWFNLAAAIPILALVWTLAPFVSAFYNEPELTPVLRAMGFSILCSMPVVVHRARLERALNFRHLTLIQLPSFLVGAAVGITMAWQGKGVWALVAMSLVSASLSSVAIWISSPWRPRFVFLSRSFREMFGFGVKSAVEKVFQTLFQNLLTIIIGRSFSATEVGFYNRARQYQQLPAQSIYAVILRVLLPMLSSVQGDKSKMRLAFLHSIRIAAIASCPVFAGLAAVAHPLVETLIGAKWLPCVPYLQLLCVSAILLPVQAINVNCILANGLSGLSLKLNFIKQGIQLALIAATFRHGIFAMLWALVGFSFLAFFINAWPNRKLVDVPIRTQLLVVAPYLALASAMAVAVHLLLPICGDSAWIRLVAGSLAGIVLYAGGLKVLRLRSHRELADLVDGLPVAGRLFRAVLA